MIVPYSQTQIRDKTIGLRAATPRASVNIAALVNSDTGRTDRVSLSNQSDLINNYLTGSAISANDNITIQSLGAMLTMAPVDVIRVNKSLMLSGIGSIGNLMYFDNNFNLIKELTKAVVKEAEISKVTWTLNIDDTDITGGSIEDVFKNLSAKGYAGYYNTRFSNIYCHSDDITVDSDINYYKPVNVLVNKYGVVDNTAASAMEINQFINIGDISFVYTGNTSESVMLSEFDNPYTIYFSQTLTNSVKATKGNSLNNLILTTILDYIYRVGGVQLPFGIKSNISLEATFSNATGDFKYFDTEDNKLTAKNGNLIISSGSIEYNGFTFYLGNAPAGVVPEKLINIRSEILDVYDHIESSTVTLNTILINLTEYINSNLGKFELSSALTLKFNENTKFYYNSDTTPSIYLPSALFTTELGSDTFTTMYHSTDEDNQSNKTYDDSDELWIAVDDVCYYYGDKPTVEGITINSWNKITIENEDESKDDSGNPTYSMQEFLDSAYRAMSEDFVCNKTKTGIVISGSHELNACNSIIINNGNDTGTVIDQTAYTDKFAIVENFANNQKLFSYNYVFNADTYSTFDVTYKYKNISKTYTISFDGKAVDGYGKPLYYDRVNKGENKDNYIHIVKLTGEEYQKNFSSASFGDEVLCFEPTIADYTDAILKFTKYKDKQYQFIWDSGYAKPALPKAMVQVGVHFNAQVVPSYPVEYKTVEDITDYYNALGLNSFEVIHCVPGHMSTYNGEFLSLIPGSFSYIAGRINAFNTVSQEFLPLFGTTNGIVPAPNLVAEFDDEDRQKLLDNNINSIVRELGKTYIIANATGQSQVSYLSEDQNVYMTNILAQICDAYNSSLHGMLNDEETRNKVVSDLNDSIQQRMIAGKKPTMNAFKVVCDTTLNTQEVIEARELIYEVWVQYTPSIAYVKAYTDVVRLNTI